MNRKARGDILCAIIVGIQVDDQNRENYIRLFVLHDSKYAKILGSSIPKPNRFFGRGVSALTVNCLLALLHFFQAKL